jgi:hypothetical protein
MKKLFYLIIVMLILGLLLPAAAVADEKTQGPSASEGMMFAATVMPLNGTWVILDEYMDEYDFFLIGSPWTWDSVFTVKFTITDLYVVTDIFEVYDGVSLVTTTPYMPDWDVLGYAGPFTSPPWESDPGTAFDSGYFSSAVIYFDPGLHSITIRDIHIPPLTAGGEPFPDGTVAFKAELYSLEVDIDIKPWSDPNSINLKSKGVVPVAFLGSAIFDVTTVDVNTLVFGPGSAEPAHDLTDPIVYADHLQDVNLDGFMDLVCHFKTQELGLVKGDTDATLTGETNDGVIVYGTDSVNIVGK